MRRFGLFLLFAFSVIFGSLALAQPTFIPNRTIRKFPQIIITIEGVHDGPDVIDRRRCSGSGEMRACTNACANQGEGVIGCSVGTIGGKMTQTCVCGNPNNYV